MTATRLTTPVIVRTFRTFYARVLVQVLCICLPSLVAAQSLPTGWSVGDVGTPAVQGTATLENTMFRVRGAGAGIWGLADQFTFASRPLIGDGDIVARVTGLDNTGAWARAGVMIRASLSATAPHAFVGVSAARGVAFQRRPVAVGESVHTAGGAGAAPMWMKLERRGVILKAYRSADGTAWTLVGTDVIAMPQTVSVGLAVTSRDTDVAAEAVFANVAVTAVPTASPGPLPSGWTSSDIGNPRVSGSAGYDAGTYTVTGAGSDIGGSVDEFQYAYRRVDGDVDIVARVTAVQKVDAWTKSGVMIRDALTSNAAHFSMFVTPREGIAFQRRPTAGGGSILTTTSTARAPFWVRLERRGASITAFQSGDGNAWTQVGTGTMTLPSVYVGLAVTSHKASRAATALFDNVTVRTPAANLPPSVSLTAPANGASFPANTSITVSADASDTDGTIASVGFYRGTTLIATDTTSPYSVTWSNVAAGTYSLTAVAADDDGATTTSSARSITVGTPPPVQYRAVFVASSNHDTAVDRYVLNIYAAGANPDTATPVATRDMGKPAVVGGECAVDISQTVQSLASGSYIATVTAVGPGGSARSAPASFTR